jgi:hypothetical protein
MCHFFSLLHNRPAKTFRQQLGVVLIVESPMAYFGRYRWQHCAITFMLSIIIVIISSSPSSYVLVVQATKVTWTGNDNILPEQMAAHNAPRSQKYWDEHGIERPDYAKTDKEIAAERRQRQAGGSDEQFRQSQHRVIVVIVVSIVVILAMVYKLTTEDWDNINRCTQSMIKAARGRGSGNTLGSSGSSLTSNRGNGSTEEDEARRLKDWREARLARFDYQRNMLDNIKEE